MKMGMEEGHKRESDGGRGGMGAGDGGIKGFMKKEENNSEWEGNKVKEKRRMKEVKDGRKEEQKKKLNKEGKIKKWGQCSLGKSRNLFVFFFFS